MRQSQQTATRTGTRNVTPNPVQMPAIRTPVATFICNACETVEHCRTPALPEKWATETIGDDIYAYCPECAVDLPCGEIQ
jgi:hypothetical protein